MNVYFDTYSNAVNYLAFDTMMAVTFNADYSTVDDPTFRYVMECIEAANVRLSVTLQSSGLTLHRIDRRLFPKSSAAASRFAKFIRRVLRDRLQGESATSKDIFSFLQGCRDPETGEGLKPVELGTETATFVVAGKIPLPDSPLRSTLWLA